MTKKNHVKLPRSVKRLFPQVTSVSDASSPIEVSVSKKDCEGAKKQNPIECALAKAAKRTYHADGVIIGISASYLIKGKEAIRFQTPESVRREIVSFDRNDDFAPGEYYLTPKSPSNRLGEIHSKSKIDGNHKPKRKIHKSDRIRILARGIE